MRTLKYHLPDLFTCLGVITCLLCAGLSVQAQGPAPYPLTTLQPDSSAKDSLYTDLSKFTTYQLFIRRGDTVIRINRIVCKGNFTTQHILKNIQPVMVVAERAPYVPPAALNNQWNATSMDDYAEAISYDPNGNILTYNRKGAPEVGKPVSMDELTYNYDLNKNRLNYINDNITSTYTEDIETQNNNNYTYDAIGNLKSDFTQVLPILPGRYTEK